MSTAIKTYTNEIKRAPLINKKWRPHGKVTYSPPQGGSPGSPGQSGQLGSVYDSFIMDLRKKNINIVI